LNRLKQLITELPEVEKEYQEMKYQRDKRYTEIYLKEFNNFRNEEMRKHAVREILEQENLVYPLMEISLKYHALLNEKEILMKIQ
jgi:hypothetical protein